MNTPQPPIDPALQPLLDALQQHGSNIRQQQALSAKIDQLALQSQPSARKHRALWWWAGAAAAACLALALILKLAAPHPVSNAPLIAEAPTNADNNHAISTISQETSSAPVSSAHQAKPSATHSYHATNNIVAQSSPTADFIANIASAEPSPADAPAEMPANLLSPAPADQLTQSQPANQLAQSLPANQYQSSEPKVFIRESTLLVCSSPECMPTKETHVSFVAMNSAKDEHPNSPIILKEFKL